MIFFYTFYFLLISFFYSSETMSSNALIKNSITALRFYGYINQNMEYVNDTLTINIDGYSCTINFKNTLIPRSNIEKAYLLLNDNYTIVLAIISNGYTDRKEYEKFLKIKGDSFKLLLYHFNVNSKNLNNIYENSIAEEITEQKINNFEINEKQLVLKIGNRTNPTDYAIDYNFARLTQPINNESDNKTINQSDENISAQQIKQSSSQTPNQKSLNTYDKNNNQSHASEQPTRKRSFIDKIKPFIFALSLCAALFIIQKYFK